MKFIVFAFFYQYKNLKKIAVQAIREKPPSLSSVKLNILWTCCLKGIFSLKQLNLSR